MQDNLATIRLWTLSQSDVLPGSRLSTSTKLRPVLWHAIGAILLAIALMAQPLATSARFPSGTPDRTSTSSSHGALTTSALPSTGAPTQSQYFASTGKTVAGD